MRVGYEETNYAFSRVVCIGYENYFTEGRCRTMIRSEYKYKSNCIIRKIILFALFLCVNICLPSCNKYAQEEKLLREEQGIKYYFVGEEADYSFKKAILTVYPNKTIKKEIIDGKADLTITRMSEDEWTVYLEDMVLDYGLNGKEFYSQEICNFSCEGDISEGSVVRGRTFHDTMQAFYYITEGFISTDEINEIIDNGERIGTELNEQLR